MSGLQLLDIIKSAVLNENRVDDAKKLAKQLGVEPSLDAMMGLSQKINPNHKYLNFIVRNFDAIFKNSADAIELLQYFNHNNAKFKKRDINQYTDLNELEKTVLKVANQKRREIEIVDGARVVYDDNAFVVIVPETKSASCYYGAGTKWCTAGGGDQYHQYRTNGELYYIISRTKPSNDPTYKMAVNMIFNRTEKLYPPEPAVDAIYNATDDVIHESILTENTSGNVLAAIRDDFKKKWNEWWEKIKPILEKEHTEAAKQAKLRQQREAARILARRNEREEARENDEYADNEEVQALRAYLINSGDWTNEDPEGIERISAEIQALKIKIEALEDNPNEAIDDELSELHAELETLENDLMDATGTDIYDLQNESYEHYGLSVYTDINNDAEYAIGTDEEADIAAHDQVESYINEFKNEPGMGFREGYLDYYIDGDEVARDFETEVDDMVRESPESYIDDDDKELTSEGKELLSEKREALSIAETRKSELDDKISEMESEMESIESDSDEYTELENLLSDLQSELEDIETEIGDLESEIDDIENGDDYKEYSEDAIKKAVEARLDDIRNDPIDELKSWGITDLNRYIDMEKLIDGVISDDGRGNGLSGYDGNENEISYNGTTYYIYRIN